ncbi:sensor domain-containing diguanylate cyclase [Thiovibrio sp. JS02]
MMMDFSKRSSRTFFLPAVAVFLLLLLAFNTRRSHLEFEESIVGNTKQQLLATAGASANALATHIQKDIKSLRLLAQDPIFSSDRNLVATGEIARKLQAFFALHGGGIDCVSVLDRNGVMLHREPFWPDGRDRRGLRLAEEESVARVLASGQAYASEAYRTRLGRLAIALSVPILHDGRLLGLLRMVLPIETLAREAFAPIAFGAGSPMLIDNRQRLLFSGAGPRNDQELSKRLREIPLQEAGVELFTPPGAAQAEKLLLAHAPAVLPNSTWTVAVSLPCQTIMAPIDRHSYLASATILLVFLFAGTGAFIIFRTQQKKQALELENRYLAELAHSHAELAKANAILKEQATRDGLTGLFNYRHFHKMLQREFRLGQRQEGDFCCLLIDLDHFKKVNDTYGHAFGDFVLQEFAGLLREMAGETDLMARYGGEEFVALLSRADLTDGAAFAERLRQRVETFVFDNGLRQCRITVSVGVASFGANLPESPQDVLACADKALYRAKAERNQVVFFRKQISQLDLLDPAGPEPRPFSPDRCN